MLQKLETELKLRGFSGKTVSAYLFHNQKFLDFIKKQPENIETDDIKKYIVHLMSEKKQKPSSINLTICALRFFYEQILEKELFKKIKSPKLEKRLPTVLTKDEIKKLLDVTSNRKHRLLIELLYSAGLRVSEAVNLKIDDMNLNEKIGIVRQGKGKKDRLFILSNTLINHIERYANWKEKKKKTSEYLFPSNKNPSAPISVRQAQKIIKVVAQKSGIRKNIYCHALRSTFATHLLESGTDIRVIQELLGHASISTTEHYVKVSTDQLKKVKSPLDSLR